MYGKGGRAGQDALDPHRPLALDEDERADGERPAVDEQVDRLVRAAREVDDGPIPTSWPSTTEVAPAAAAIIWFIASPTADRSSSVSSSSPASSPVSWPIMAAARRRAPRRLMAKTLPPVTPSTYETLAT